MELTFCTWERLHLAAPIALTFGNFDGVHRGHQALLKLLVQEARQRGLPACVLLFEPQPQTFFRGQQAPARLSTLRDKFKIFSQLGVDRLICLRFNHSLAQLSAHDFVERLLFKQLKADYLLLGEDSRFGEAREGDVKLLGRLAEKHKKTLQLFPNYRAQVGRVSSTLVRRALAEGDFDGAEALLGRAYTVSGRVVYGQQLGRQLGVPTANLLLRHPKPPIQGVFAVHLALGAGAFTPGIANWGLRPTCDGLRRVLEVHGFELSGAFYGQRLTVQFLNKLRDEQRFDSLEALKAQIDRDLAQAKAFFEHQKVLCE